MREASFNDVPESQNERQSCCFKVNDVPPHLREMSSLQFSDILNFLCTAVKNSGLEINVSVSLSGEIKLPKIVELDE